MYLGEDIVTMANCLHKEFTKLWKAKLTGTIFIFQTNQNSKKIIKGVIPLCRFLTFTLELFLQNYLYFIYEMKKILVRLRKINYSQTFKSEKIFIPFL